jgi:protein farnesyltransferase subunit beta
MRQSVADCLFLNAGSGYACLDASRPWLVYWIVHALDLIGSLASQRSKYSSIVQFLGKCQDPQGGFCGGPLQLPHLAPTYAAVNALLAIGTEEAYEAIDRPALYRFLMARKSAEGGFYMHDGGEVDIRGSYCALSVASVTNLLTPELTAGCAEFLVRCQTYEGGFAGYPGNEAHGGYSFCGLAACAIIECMEELDADALLHWCTAKQLTYEGGFNGRTNKVVDSCYSFWQGGVFPLLHRMLKARRGQGPPVYGSGEEAPEGTWLFDQKMLQKYTLLAAQAPTGGLKDKPGKGKDYYHTCYALSGLSVSQHCADAAAPCVLGEDENLLRQTDEIHNVCLDKVEAAYEFFQGKGQVQSRRT